MKLAVSHPMRAPSERQAVAGIVLLATLAAALVVTLGLGLYRGPALSSPYPLNGHRAVYPPIRDDQYSRSCEVFRAYADETAFAFCDVDHSAYRWEPAQERWSSITTTR